MSDPHVRAGDADRERVVDALEGAYVDGQLDQSEFARRTEIALQATTLGELDSVVADLPNKPDHSRPDDIAPVGPDTPLPDLNPPPPFTRTNLLLPAATLVLLLVAAALVLLLGR